MTHPRGIPSWERTDPLILQWLSNIQSVCDKRQPVLTYWTSPHCCSDSVFYPWMLELSNWWCGLTATATAYQSRTNADWNSFAIGSPRNSNWATPLPFEPKKWIFPLSLSRPGLGFDCLRHKRGHGSGSRQNIRTGRAVVIIGS